MPPVMANYYLTYKCNSRCTYCDIPIKPENIRIKETSPETIIENLAALKRLGVKVVDFTGGEPLIYKHLPQVLKAAKEMGFFTSIANTGTLYPRMAKEIAGLVDDLKFSLSTTDSSEYAKERGIDGYEKVIAAIKLAKSLGEQPSIIATATPESIGGMEKVIRLAQELGVVVLLGPVFDFCENELLAAEGIKEIKRLAEYDNVCVNWAFLQFYLDGGNQISKPRCRAISSVVVVSPDDHLLLPCYHMHDEQLKIQHENGRSNLDEMWHSMHVQDKRKKEGSWAFCQNCTIWCYFETSFLWPPDKYFFLNLKSKGQWAKEKIKQLVESKTGLNFTRKLPGSDSKTMVEVSANPLNHFRDDENIVATTPVALPTREIGTVSSNLPAESDPNVLSMDEATAVVITPSKSNAQIH
ncbi:MAG: radical SAM protein [Candidatus Obscuribacterales bacterium]|nr:radical SAM protein [Candidatus Obscuribacterales bacterium]